MRHLYGIALAVTMTAVMFFVGAWGYLRLLKLPVPPGQVAALPAGGGSLVGNSTVLLALAAVAATAVLAGLLVTVPWFSPLASGLPGLLLLAWTALFLVSVRRAVAFIPLRAQAFGAGWEGLLFNGILGAAGAVMIFPLFVPSRWRGRGTAEDPVDEFLSTVGTETPPHERSPLVGTVPAGPRRAYDDSYMDGPARPYRRADRPLRPDGLPRPRGPRDPRDPRDLRDPRNLRDPRDPRNIQPVDTTRVTGASRALRSTGSFRAASGPMPMRRDDPRPTAPLETGTEISSLLGRPYLRNDE